MKNDQQVRMSDFRPHSGPRPITLYHKLRRVIDKKALYLTALGLSVLTLVACQPKSDRPTMIDQAAIIASADGTTGWYNYGRTYDEQRFSPATQINVENVAGLGLDWYADMDTARGQEATPLVIDGKLYITTAWSKVKAYDGKTGALLWEYDPQVSGETAVKACCDVVNRGLAAWEDQLYLAALDGRLIALNRDTGKPVWSTQTVDPTQQYTSTGAPRIIGGRVIIGNGGAEMGVRGYISAYDAKTGEKLWRFYTVPDNPANGEQAPHLEKAAKTWFGEWWKLGGGGTVWDAMAYDPDLDLLYIGVGNGSPWNQKYRSEGKGDNLYLSSIVAVRPDTGKYVWHYQTTPGETWDFTATQHIMLADMEIEGRQRKVLMQAPKNGFFYVLDRETGEFISANNFSPVNWASGIDQTTGRPIENPEARYYKTGKPFIGTPGATGAHSWQPMAYDPVQNLVFIPTNIAAFPYFPDDDWEPADLGFNVGVDFAAAEMPADPAIRQYMKSITKGALVAWDPVAQKEVWRVDYNGPWNGGLLATKGGLVFQGTAVGDFKAYHAKTGQELWTFDAQTGVMAAPVTYTIDGTQYVAVLAGWGGSWSLGSGVLHDVSGPVRNISRLLVFKLGAEAALPPAPPLADMILDPPTPRATQQVVDKGRKVYARFCTVCHGDSAVGGALIPDLRRSSLIGSKESWNMVVSEGILSNQGMVGWKEIMTPDQIEAIRHYVILRANEDKALEAQAGSTGKTAPK